MAQPYVRTPEIRLKNSIASTKLEVGYFARHYRVYKALGKALDRTCKCGRPAKEWAHRHDTNPYDMTNYEAMCLSCHARYDHMEKNFEL